MIDSIEGMQERIRELEKIVIILAEEAYLHAISTRWREKQVLERFFSNPHFRQSGTDSMEDE